MNALSVCGDLDSGKPAQPPVYQRRHRRAAPPPTHTNPTSSLSPLLVDHIGMVWLTVGSWSAFVASFDVAERRLAFLVAVVLADMKLSIVGNH